MKISAWPIGCPKKEICNLNAPRPLAKPGKAQRHKKNAVFRADNNNEMKKV